ncbi:hypothetical protein L484_020835 [Morus notabilis]|uniref:Uncharacterized protein n=1 Tax=Morus notabilis TaxID=981085 RepID=W9QP09_9ROSA|nr:hypothetical protein L484_020835 [Morus notabilis]
MQRHLKAKLEHNKIWGLNGKCHYRKDLKRFFFSPHKEGYLIFFHRYLVLDKMRGHHMASQSQLCLGTTLGSSRCYHPIYSS